MEPLPDVPQHKALKVTFGLICFLGTLVLIGVVGVAAWFLLFLSSQKLVAPAPPGKPALKHSERHLAHVESTPDMSQIDRQLPGGGEQHCASVAVSNSLVWLARNGYPRLLDEKMSQIELAKLLGDKAHMQTHPRNGTNTWHLLAGLDRYVKARGYAPTLQFQGWWLVQNKYRHEDAMQVDLTWLLRGVEGKRAAAWINIGWYSLTDSEKQTYTRLSGHWVTLVGHDTRTFDDQTERVLIVHDPAARSPVGQHEAIRLTRLTRGKLTGVFLGMQNIQAAGVYQLSGELRLQPHDGEKVIALLDGAIVMRLK